MADPVSPFAPSGQPQDLDALGRSLPPADTPNFTGPWAQANPVRQAMEAPLRQLQYAMMYPARVAQRWDRERTLAGNPPSWPPSHNDGSRQSTHLAPFLADQLRPLMAGVDKMDPTHSAYVPGSRRSDHVENRSPASVWQYW